MVILVVGILASIGITQFVNFGKDARESATKANLQVLRRAISAQNGMMRLRCGVVDDAFPLLAALTANDITETGSPCHAFAAAFTDADKVFVAGGIPANPWTNSNAIVACTTASPTVATNASGGWCYDVATGQIWADSKQNTGDGSTGTEATY